MLRACRGRKRAGFMGGSAAILSLKDGVVVSYGS